MWKLNIQFWLKTKNKNRFHSNLWDLKRHWKSKKRFLNRRWLFAVLPKTDLSKCVTFLSTYFFRPQIFKCLKCLSEKWWKRVASLRLFFFFLFFLLRFLTFQNYSTNQSRGLIEGLEPFSINNFLTSSSNLKNGKNLDEFWTLTQCCLYFTYIIFLSFTQVTILKGNTMFKKQAGKVKGINYYVKTLTFFSLWRKMKLFSIEIKNKHWCLLVTNVSKNFFILQRNFEQKISRITKICAKSTSISYVKAIILLFSSNNVILLSKICSSF